MDWLDAVGTRRALLRRSGLLAGIGLTALLAGCSRGDDDDDEDLPRDDENSGLDKGAEDRGEEPGLATEAGIEDRENDRLGTPAADD
jgi:hypothetical protein